MSDLTTNETLLAALRAPVRNRYFYGKLLDVSHLEREQDYGVTQNWLMNRLGLGAGVLCGLQLEVGEQGVLVRPGVAVDGLGRVIVVPSAYCIADPAQPTDDAGQPAGDRVVDGVLTVRLCYLECAGDPTPVLVGDCDSRNGTAAGSTIERYRIGVREGDAPARRGMTEEQCSAVFPDPWPDGHDPATAACAALGGTCAPPEESCVVLGEIRTDADGAVTEVRSCEVRTTIYSNARLFELIACLARHVADCCAKTTAALGLRYLAGDAQQGKPGDTLPVRLQVQVVDAGGSGVDGTDVTFRVQTGGAELSDGVASGPQLTVASAGGGAASATLTLGPAAGPASVEATIAGGARVVFTVWGIDEVEPQPLAPVVLRLRPVPGQLIRRGDGGPGSEWWDGPSLTVTFDQEMDGSDLGDPDRWLRLWFLRPADQDVTHVRRIPLQLSDVLGDPQHAAVYRLEFDRDEYRSGFAGVIQIRAENDTIRSATTPPVQLDADFAGTTISAELLEKLWEAEDDQFPAELWEQIGDSGAFLPQSGDGVPGGFLHSWFHVGGR